MDGVQAINFTCREDQGSPSSPRPDCLKRKANRAPSTQTSDSLPTQSPSPKLVCPSASGYILAPISTNDCQVILCIISNGSQVILCTIMCTIMCIILCIMLAVNPSLSQCEPVDCFLRQPCSGASLGQSVLIVCHAESR